MLRLLPSFVIKIFKMDTKDRDKSGSFEERLQKLMEQLESEKRALNKILKSIEENNNKEKSLKRKEK